MEKNISCRYMQVKDHDEVRELLAGNRLPTDRVNAGNTIMLVAEQGGRIIGCGGITPIGESGILQSLVVNKKNRSRGCGSLLVDRLISVAALHALRELFLLTISGRDFFRKLGFSPIGGETIPSQVRQTVAWKNPDCAAATSMHLDITRQARYFPQETLRLRDDLPGVQLWAVSLQKTMLTYFTVDANSSFPQHSHESEQITMVLSGALYFTVHGDTRKVGKGEVIALPADVEHAVFTLDEKATAVDAWSPVMKRYQ